MSWDETVDEAVTEALYSLGLVQSFADGDDRFEGVDSTAGAVEMVDLLREVRSQLDAAMKESGYTVVRPANAAEEATEGEWYSKSENLT